MAAAIGDEAASKCFDDLRSGEERGKGHEAQLLANERTLAQATNVEWVSESERSFRQNIRFRQ